jgi:hypothetical protein
MNLPSQLVTIPSRLARLSKPQGATPFGETRFKDLKSLQLLEYLYARGIRAPTFD